jgi:hypothetical protein
VFYVMPAPVAGIDFFAAPEALSFSDSMTECVVRPEQITLWVPVPCRFASGPARLKLDFLRRIPISAA